MEYEKLKDFFKLNMEIKQIMIDIAPPLDTEALNEDAMIKYTDKCYEELRYVIMRLENFFNDDRDIFAQKLKILSGTWMNKLIEANTDRKKLNEFYKTCISSMDEEFVKKCKI